MPLCVGHIIRVGEHAQLVLRSLCAVICERAREQIERLRAGGRGVEIAAVIRVDQAEVDRLAQIIHIPRVLRGAGQAAGVVRNIRAQRAVQNDNGFRALDRVIRQHLAVHAVEQAERDRAVQRILRPVARNVREGRGGGLFRLGGLLLGGGNRRQRDGQRVCGNARDKQARLVLGKAAGQRAAAVFARVIRGDLRDFLAVHRDGEFRGRIERLRKGFFALFGEADLDIGRLIVGKPERAFRHIRARQPDLAVRVRERQFVLPCEELRHAVGVRARGQGHKDGLPVIRERNRRPGEVQLVQTVLEHGAHLFSRVVRHLVGSRERQHCAGGRIFLRRNRAFARGERGRQQHHNGQQAA